MAIEDKKDRDTVLLTGLPVSDECRISLRDVRMVSMWMWKKSKQHRR